MKSLIAWMREHFTTVQGMKTEPARLMACRDLGQEITHNEMGDAFIRVDFERRGEAMDEGWKHAKREDLPDEEQRRRERNLRTSPGRRCSSCQTGKEASR